MAFDRDLMKTLRKEGFRREWLQRHQDGDVTEYHRWDDTRLVEVQLFQEGGGRATNMLIIESDRRRLRGTTHPTEFSNVKQMLAAIGHEAVRDDHKP